jgi:hypothetical protein
MKRHRVPVSIGGFAVAAALIYREVFVGKVLAGRDVFRLFIPQAHFLAECLRRHELPLWIPYERLGQPFAAIPYAQAFYLPNLLAVLLTGPVISVTALHLFHVAVAAGGTYAACRRLRASRFAGIFGAAAFALSHLYTLLAWAPNVAGAAAWSGFQLAAAHRLSRAPTLRPAALLAASLAASLLCGSPETTLWQLALLLTCIVAWSRRPRRRRRAALAFSGAVVSSAALAAVMLLPALELAAESTRTEGVWKPLEWSVSWPQLLSIAWPLAHVPMGPYRGGSDQHYLTSLFMGSVVCALAASALSRRRGRRATPLGAAAAGFALLSLGGNFRLSAGLLTLPPFDFFRYPVKYAVGAGFCLAVLSALGLDRAAARARAFGREQNEARSVTIVCAAALVFAALGLAALRAFAPRFGMQLGWLWLIAALSSAAIAWLVGGQRRWPIAIVATVELGAAHLLLGAPAFAPAAALSVPSLLAAAIERPFDGRVSVPVPDEVPTQGDFHQYVEASRDALMPLRFLEEELRAFEGYGDPEPSRIWALEQSTDRATYDLVGVRYYVRAGPPPFDDLEPIAHAGSFATLYKSETARPRAFIEAPCHSQVKLTEPRFTELRLDVDACAAAELVVTDAWFPGWEATVDGAPTELRESHGGVRAVALGAGKHAVNMRYAPRPFFVGAAISTLTLGALALLLARKNTNAASR